MVTTLIIIGALGALVLAVLAVLVVERIRRSVNATAALRPGWKPTAGTVIGRDGRRS